MTLPAATYDLVVMLDVEVEEQARAKILADAGAAISEQGELLRHDKWGRRELTYPIDHKTAAEYHLLQFHAGSPELLKGLDRSLRIADEVIRFRIVKLAPGTPEAPDMHGATTGRTAEAETGGTAEAQSQTDGTTEAEAQTEGTEAEAQTDGTTEAEAQTGGTTEAEAQTDGTAGTEVEVGVESKIVEEPTGAGEIVDEPAPATPQA